MKVKVTFGATAYSYLDYEQEVEVPDNATSEEIDGILADMHRDIDGGEYVEVATDWEDGDINWERQ